MIVRLIYGREGEREREREREERERGKERERKGGEREKLKIWYYVFRVTQSLVQFVVKQRRIIQ